MPRQPISVRGARQHNLKGIDLDLPRRSLTVITGPSGSGKSSLALDTLFSEGQRRYVESLSTYAKQFLERVERPHVDSIDGLSPTVAIERRNPTRSSRSTVGTATEVHDYLRLLWARVGCTHCPECDRPVSRDTVSAVVDSVLALPAGARVRVGFPLPPEARRSGAAARRSLLSLGFTRAVADGHEIDLSEGGDSVPRLSDADEVLVIVDRLVVGAGLGERLADGVATCFVQGEGKAVVLRRANGTGPTTASSRISFSERFQCPDHPEIDFPELAPRLFSFNNPYGSCAECKGFGAILTYDPDLIVPDEGLSLTEGAVDPWQKPRYGRERARLLSFAAERKVPKSAPWRELPEDFRLATLNGGPGFIGVIPFLRSRERKRYKRHIRIYLRRYQRPHTCPACSGDRLRSEARWVRVGGLTIGHVCSLPIRDLRDWTESLELSSMERETAAPVLVELSARLDFLNRVGLGYLTLSRPTRTLSGGEAQRIHLANSLGSSLFDTLYLLDEPTIGLHPNDTDGLLELVCRLRDVGNTIVVVEHDRQAIMAADHVVELGPGSGEQGGEVVFEGTPKELVGADTVTGRHLAGRSNPPARVGRPKSRRWLSLRGARLHNLRGVDVDVPIGSLTVVTGVSGSGKSTLVHDVLYWELEGALGGGTTAREYLGEEMGSCDSLSGTELIESVVLVDQMPIGRTPRSNAATYMKAWDEVRRLFAKEPKARELGLGPGHFSFNLAGGRCEECDGAGSITVEMVFLADVRTRCPVCSGTRYQRSVLEVRMQGKNVHEVLEMTVDRAIRFFGHNRKLGRILWRLQQVGLGYLRLGQPATTLSSGEAQRLKIARELTRPAGRAGRRLYLLDEPTTGLAGEEVAKLLGVLDRLVEAGNTVIVIEHDLEVIRFADWIIDMGPGAGDLGGRVVAQGTPQEVANAPESITGRYLAKAFSGRQPSSSSRDSAE